MPENNSLDSLRQKLNDRYDSATVHNIVENEDGSLSIVLSGDENKLNAALKKLNNSDISELPVIAKKDIDKFIIPRYATRASSLITRDKLGPGYLDLAISPSIMTASPQDLYERAAEYYKTEDVYGSSIDILTNFAAKGFVNDIDDPNIRNFYDNWVIDTGFDKIVEQIFFECFRSGFVRTYKVVGKYEPKINYVSPIPGQKATKVSKESADRYKKEFAEKYEKKESGAKKIKWSKDYIPIKYTILNPTLIEIEKSSLLLDQQFVILKSKALGGIKEILETEQSALTEHQKLIIKSLTPEMKTAALDGADLPLDPYLTGAVDYRRQPYELYPYPRGARAFESMEYKKNLRQADYSTLDGITNYILVITIGNDEFPVKSQAELEAVAELFNTPSKSFNAVWNHTLKVQKVEPSDVGDILGQDKYKQVNDDITGAFGVIRALIDGVGNPTKAGAELAVKALLEEINYVRKEVSRWIYREYRDVAEAMGFDRYPKVRFNNMILKDEIQMMTVIQGMLDRRILSYKAGLEMLGYDYDTVKAQMEEEAPLVQDGTLGIIGSPYQQFRGGSSSVQDTQKTPKGTPSEGRPKNQPAKTPEVPTKPASAKPEKANLDIEEGLGDMVGDMSLEDLYRINQYFREKLLNKIDSEDQE